MKAKVMISDILREQDPVALHSLIEPLSKERKKTLFLHACRHGYTDLAKAMVDRHGVPTDSLDSANNFAIALASKSSHELTLWLLERGVDHLHKLYPSQSPFYLIPASGYAGNFLEGIEKQGMLKKRLPHLLMGVMKGNCDKELKWLLPKLNTEERNLAMQKAVEAGCFWAMDQCLEFGDIDLESLSPIQFCNGVRSKVKHLTLQARNCIDLNRVLMDPDCKHAGFSYRDRSISPLEKHIDKLASQKVERLFGSVKSRVEASGASIERLLEVHLFDTSLAILKNSCDFLPDDYVPSWILINLIRGGDANRQMIEKILERNPAMNGMSLWHIVKLKGAPTFLEDCVALAARQAEDRETLGYNRLSFDIYRSDQHVSTSRILQAIPFDSPLIMKQDLSDSPTQLYLYLAFTSQDDELGKAIFEQGQIAPLARMIHQKTNTSLPMFLVNEITPERMDTLFESARKKDAKGVSCVDFIYEISDGDVIGFIENKDGSIDARVKVEAMVDQGWLDHLIHASPAKGETPLLTSMLAACCCRKPFRSSVDISPLLDKLVERGGNVCEALDHVDSQGLVTADIHESVRSWILAQSMRRAVKEDLVCRPAAPLARVQRASAGL